MLLTIDAGNTNIKLGIFKNDELLHLGIFDTYQDDYRSLVLSFLYKNNLREDDLDCAAFSCVVPAIYDKVMGVLENIVGSNIIDINPAEDYGIKLDIPEPLSVGDDLLVMDAYAYNLFHRDMIVVSVGTATVLTHITEDGCFKHCIITPGFLSFAKTLWSTTAQLKEIKAVKRDSYLANDTEGAMNVGIYNGYIDMVDSLIKNLAEELGTDPYIVVCGGVGKQVAPYLHNVDYFEADLVTMGLNYIYKRRNNG